MHIVHMSLQELQAVALMLPRMAFCLSGKVVALYLDNITAKPYFYNHVGMVPLFFRVACHVMNHTDKPFITPFLSYLSISMWKPTIYCEEDQFHSGIFIFT